LLTAGSRRIPVHGGLLYRGVPEQRPPREAWHPAHRSARRQFVSFEKTVAHTEVTLGEAIENIDIGGPALLRSAAKNHESVTVVMDPNDYAEVLSQIQEKGRTTLEMRRKLAMQVFARTSAYDATIASYLVKVFSPPATGPAPAAPEAHKPTSALPGWLMLEAPQVQRLRYGENPHQMGGLYGRFNDYFTQLQGGASPVLTSAARLIAEFAMIRPRSPSSSTTTLAAWVRGRRWWKRGRKPLRRISRPRLAAFWWSMPGSIWRAPRWSRADSWR
jgi:phosphoribosylaminoimidazolecarboxamide formyltransferase/IMP cyclohydrolase